MQSATAAAQTARPAMAAPSMSSIRTLPPLSSLHHNTDTKHRGLTTATPTRLSFCATPSQMSRPGSAAASPGMRCSHCGSSETPLWRRSPHTSDLLCNACGLHKKFHGTLRPLEPEKQPRNRSRSLSTQLQLGETTAASISRSASSESLSSSGNSSLDTLAEMAVKQTHPAMGTWHPPLIMKRLPLIEHARTARSHPYPSLRRNSVPGGRPVPLMMPRPVTTPQVGYFPGRKAGELLPCIITPKRVYRVGDGVTVCVDVNRKKILYGVIRGFFQQQGQWMFNATWIKADTNPDEDRVARETVLVIPSDAEGHQDLHPLPLTCVSRLLKVQWPPTVNMQEFLDTPKLLQQNPRVLTVTTVGIVPSPPTSSMTSSSNTPKYLTSDMANGSTVALPHTPPGEPTSAEFPNQMPLSEDRSQELEIAAALLSFGRHK